MERRGGGRGGGGGGRGGRGGGGRRGRSGGIEVGSEGEGLKRGGVEWGGDITPSPLHHHYATHCPHRNVIR